MQMILEIYPVAIIVLSGVDLITSELRDSCCVATVLLKPFALLLQARISVIFLFYNRSRVAP